MIRSPNRAIRCRGWHVLRCKHRTPRRPLRNRWSELQHLISGRASVLENMYSTSRGPLQVFDLLRDPPEDRDLNPTVSLRDATQIRVDLLAWRSRVARTFLEPDAVLRAAMPVAGVEPIRSRVH